MPGENRELPAHWIYRRKKHMLKVNENYLKLPGSYLFSTIGKKVRAFQEANPDKEVIRLGIGDVTHTAILLSSAKIS